MEPRPVDTQVLKVAKYASRGEIYFGEEGVLECIKALVIEDLLGDGNFSRGLPLAPLAKGLIGTL